MSIPDVRVPLVGGVTAALLWAAPTAAPVPGDPTALRLLDLLRPAVFGQGYPMTEPVVVVVTSIAMGALVAAALACAVATGQRRALALIGIGWGAVVLATLVCSGALALGSLIGGIDYTGWRAGLARQLDSLGNGLWVVAAGWIPGLVGWALRDRQPVPTSEPSRRLGVIAFSLLAAVVVLSGVAGVLVARAESTRYDTVPTAGQDETEAPAPPVPDPTAPPTPEPSDAAAPQGQTTCTIGDLAISLGTADAATGHRVQYVFVRNAGLVECTISGYPGITVLNRVGGPLALDVLPGGGFMAIDSGPVTVTLPPGASAGSTITWDAGPNAADSDSAGTLQVAPIPGVVVNGEAGAQFDFVKDVTAGQPVGLTTWQPFAG